MKKFIDKIYGSIFIRYSKFFSRHNFKQFVLINAKKIKKNKVILNIGAGGEVAELLKLVGLKFKEVDIDPLRKPDYIMSIENMDKIKSNSIDVIFCMEVLEHVANPFKAVSEIQRVLKKNGIFIGSTPFILSIHDEPYDFFRYTKYGIRNLFSEFEELYLTERNSYIFSIYVLALRLVNIGNYKQRFIGVLLFPFLVLLLPFFYLVSLLVTNKQATTGYNFIYKKK